MKGLEAKEGKTMPDKYTHIVLLGALTATGAVALILRWTMKRWLHQRRMADLHPSTPVITFAPGADREFADRVDKFSGLYESLHAACAGRRDPDECRLVLSEWEIRLSHSGGEALQRTWHDVVRDSTGSSKLADSEAADYEGVFSLGDTWLDLLRTWGMERDERTTFVLGEGEEKRYRIGGTRRVGEVVEVELPCWTYEGEVIERGIARTVATPS